jgi:transposase
MAVVSAMQSEGKAMLRRKGKSLVLEGPAGALAAPADDEVTEKLFMLFEGVCTAVGPAAAAAQHGYTKQRFYQLLKQFEEGGALALQNHKRGPKGKSRRTDEVIRQVIRHRFLDPDASAEVIAQKMTQTGHPISIRSVQRVIESYGLQKKTAYVRSQTR